MRLLKLTPADSFFFKGHMMSEMGVPSQWSGLFPPRPNTVYGALRSAYIHQGSTFEAFRHESDAHMKEWMGTPKEMGKFRQQAVFIRQNREILLPVPLDYRIYSMIEHGEEKLKADILTLAPNRVLSNVRAGYTLTRTGEAAREGKDKEHHGQYVPLEQWCQAIFMQEEIQDIRLLSQIVDGYMKTGIKIDAATSGAEDAHFFQMNMLTMRQECQLVSLVSEKEAPDFSKVPMVSLGAENRPWFLGQEHVNWQVWSEEQLNQIVQSLHDTKRARIILLTPLVLPENCPLSQPEQTEDWLWELFPGVHVRLLTWVTGRAELYGGWDIVANRPKPRQLMLPAGTVFYVGIEPEDITSLSQVANGFHLFGGETEGRDQEGFGFAVIASIKP
ncbi:type III-B CRISPR module-associated protein Cmr3 [Paenibacillus amylolyticus]|uniref:type III-B CRISPR module-associated protein Cmr3 n=1 Tax=Paenibacillus amylolyticus TaxID=1451 RepID=UPI00201D4E3A|nr:type III-B CRISPR module-associated protein Cmr3 [Paenibacillus amylolyticus]